MVQLRTQRTALALYGVLLVLPTVVLGGLQWNQIVSDRAEELAAVPRAAEDAALRFENAMRAELGRLVGGEEQRPFQQYGLYFYPGPATDGASLPIGTPLFNARRPPGVISWMVFDLADARYGEEPRVDFFWGDGHDDRASLGEDLAEATRTLIRQSIEDGYIRRTIRLGDYDREPYPLRDLAASRARPEDQECMAAQQELLTENEVPVLTSRMHLQYFESPRGTPRIVATRRVLVEELRYLRGLNPCLHRLSRGMGLMQGFFIDPRWLFGELPTQVAASVLDPSQRFVTPGESCCTGGTEVHAEIPLLSALDVEVRDPWGVDVGSFRIAVDTGDIEARYNARVRRFLGVALMLAISLSTGMVLLLRSVSKDLEQAQRTENFVAAVTHELRTPLASIKLHGEMLLDGWAQDPAKQKEYHRRIVRETERLSTLVERVLEQSRLSAGASRPMAGDLDQLVADLEQPLRDEAVDGSRDLAFELDGDLPPVMLTPESVASILINLVENARKYAPVDTRRPDAEPIRVVTRKDASGEVLLEVLDRGPGVPRDERRMVFEAFYRAGSEATRTTRGTGLGLHLVQLQAQAIGATVRIEDRPGGGALFRVTFQRAPADAA